MKPKKYVLAGIVLCLFSYSVKAQIYAQGKNINKGNVFYVEVELVPKPMDPNRYHAAINFYGRRGDVDWYVKEGVEHKAFLNSDEMIQYFEDNGWFYLKKRNGRSMFNARLATDRYYFRKSMEKLSSEYNEQAKNVEQ